MLAFAPLSTASWGVAIRQAEEEALAPTIQLKRRLLIGGAIATTLSQTLNLEEMLGSALQKVLELTKTEYGCIFLRRSDGRTLEMKSTLGSADLFRCPESGSATAHCACHQVVHREQALMVNRVSQCPMLGQERMKEEGNGCFVSVPLQSKVRALGVMNIACSRERCFTEEDFRLLDSIGRQMGLAIENSFLYEDAKQKEELRGQLLNKVISAPEDWWLPSEPMLRTVSSPQG